MLTRLLLLWTRCLVAAAPAAFALPMLAHAIDPGLPLDQLQRSTWGRADGVPPKIGALAQTRDGFLWMSAIGGLTRFDGVSFDRVTLNSQGPLPSGAASLMQADPDGGLWVAYASGPVLHVRGLNATALPSLPASAGRVRQLRPDAGGRLWVAAAAGVFELRNGGWQPLPPDSGLAGTTFDDLLFDATGAMWVLSDAGVFRRRQPGAGFERLFARESAPSITGLHLARGGGVWLWTGTGGDQLCLVRPAAPTACWRSAGMLQPAADAHGALWWPRSNGMVRLAEPSALRPEDPADLERRLEHHDTRVDALLVAHDGSIWAISADSLVQLRESPLRQARTPSGAVVPGENGEIFVASFSRGLMRLGRATPGAALMLGRDNTLWTAAAVAQGSTIKDGNVYAPFDGARRPDEPVVLQRYPEAGTTVVRLDRDRQGQLLLGALSPPRLVRVSGGQAETIELPALQRGAVMRGAGTDSKGALWFAASRTPVSFFRRSAAGWQAHGGLAAVETPRLINLQLDAQDRVWMAMAADSVGVVDSGRWRSYGAADGLAIGPSLAVQASGAQLWVSGEQGVATLVDGRFHTLAGANQQAFLGCSGMQQVADGDLWLNCAEGVFRILRAEWERATRSPGHRVAFTRFDHLDGLHSGARQGGPLPAMAQGSDGRLWFATSEALHWLDPAALPPARPAPVVTMRPLVADEQAYAVVPGLVLPAGTQRVQFAYLAPGAEVPQRTRFRYRLHGVDADWVEAGTRREVGYSRLSPGEHRFEIVASDRDGRWGDRPTVLAFHLRPAFHQTTLFYALLALAATGLLAAAYVLRLRQVSGRIRREMGARLEERTRIARELHDTLLQSVHGLVLHFQAVAARLPPGDPLRARAEAALERAEATINEGRDRVVDLREPAPSRTDLAHQLRPDAQALAGPGGPHIQLLQPLPPRALHPLAHEQLLEMGREALSNALRHAQARHVQLSLSYAADAFTLTVSDDGIGFPAEVLAQGGRAGHWGLQGLHERAALVGAELALEQAEGGGAVVRIRLPALLAYAEPAPPRRGTLQRLMDRFVSAFRAPDGGRPSPP